ncbi:MAG: DNA mismatch repair endonuclease MutL [Ruminococcus sp.]|nr:DNA mismatch repair endonuclease MutL [Candidatus Copronaster equi]
MPTINVLPKHIAELIAAGEVVERPASVVKEALENSIDAGADKITVEIKRGGITYIRITDNGCGIDRANIRKAFVSHATSKILTEEDLNSVYTLGFRGEALASIAAVSRVEIMTCSEDEEIGTRYCIEGGEEMLLDDAGCPKGTTLIIRDIFYNTPARMKFLKKDVTEGNAISGVIDRIALSHPEVSIRFIRDDKDVLFTTGDGKLESAIYKVFGKEFASTLIPCSYELDGVKVSGFISKPFNARPNRSMQFYFLNNRSIRTKTGYVAMDEAYKNQIMTGKFPACVLNIEIAAGAVDINVHPSKMEVRFANEKLIYNAIYYCVKTALQNGDTRVQATFKQVTAKQFMPQPVKGEQIKIQPEKKVDFWTSVKAENYQNEAVKASKTVKPEPVYQEKIVLRDESKLRIEDESIDLLSFNEKKDEPKQEIKPVIKEEIKAEPIEIQPVREEIEVEPFRVVGEAFKTYIIVEQGEKMLIIDKHAAHERILFEKYKSQRDGIETQMLLSPLTVTLNKDEYSAVLENLELLEKAGYTVEDFGGGMVIVSECPTAVADGNLSEVIMELAGYLADNQKELVPEKLDWIYHSTACRAAIKAGDRTSDYEMNIFVENLLSNPDIRYCPHGRPVLIEMSRYEIEKNFGRI